MNTRQIACTHCGQLMGVSEEHLGAAVHCPHCQGLVRVPLEKPEPTPDQVFLTPVTEPARRRDDELRDVIVRTRPQGGGMFVPILLVFLIPYALAMTGFVVYLLYQRHQERTNQADPLERLPDPKPDEGGPRQIQHNLKLPDHLLTPLQHAVRVGDIEVTPVHVKRSAGDLILVLDMHNVSEGEEFNPVHEEFVNKDRLPIYVYLGTEVEKNGGDRPRGVMQYVYGGTWKVLRDGKEEALDNRRRIGPGQHMTVQLTTRAKDRTTVAWFLKNPRDVVWRVQVRRGLMETRRGPRSATAVIGVRFNTAAVEEARKQG